MSTFATPCVPYTATVSVGGLLDSLYQMPTDGTNELRTTPRLGLTDKRHGRSLAIWS
jgi:hypothetical protein